MRTWLARHAQTLLGSLGRLVSHPTATCMTMAVIGIALALPLLFGVFVQNVRNATSTWNQAFDMSIFMAPTTNANRAQTFAKTLRSRADVASVRVITAEEGLAEFRTASGFGNTLDALGENPLPDTLVVTPTAAASNPDAMNALQNAVAEAPGVQTVQLDTQWVGRLQTILEIMTRIVWLTGAILGLGVSLVIGNTIRLDILNRRDEIEVLKLVGATDGFARRPFLYAGIWYGLGGGLLSAILVYACVAIVRAPAERLASLYGSQLRIVGLDAASICGLIGIATLLGWLGSWLAASRHIRGINPT